MVAFSSRQTDSKLSCVGYFLKYLYEYFPMQHEILGWSFNFKTTIKPSKYFLKYDL